MWPCPLKSFIYYNRLYRPIHAMSSISKNLSCQCAPSEVLVRWSNSCWNTSPTHMIFDIGIRVAFSDHFCNFPKPTVRHSHPLHTVIGQLCGGEKVRRVWTSLSSSFFHLLHNYFCHFSCEQPCARLWMPSRSYHLKICSVIPINNIMSPPSLRQPACHSAFQCVRSNFLKTLLTADMVGQHVIWAACFLAPIDLLLLLKFIVLVILV